MNYRKKVVLMLGVLSYLNLGTFSQAAPLTVDHTSVAGVQQASNDKKTIKISGSVRDAAGESIIGATILEKGTSNGVVSDMDGNFSMTVAANGILHISYIGYVDQDIAVAGKSLFNIQLLEDTEMLDEVVADEATLETWIFDKQKAEVIFAIKDGKEVGFGKRR